MKTIAVCVLMLGLSIAVSQAQSVDTTQLPPGVQKSTGRSKGGVTSAETRNVDGQTVSGVELKEKVETSRTLYAVVLGDNDEGKNKDEDNDRDNGKGKAKGKGKGKAKGKNKDKGNHEGDREESVDKPQEAAKTPPPNAPTEAPKGNAPAAANPKPAVAAPGTPQSAAAQAKPAPAPARSAAEVRKDLDTRVRRINTLEGNPAVAKAGLEAISKETGTPVARLQSQLAQHRVGYAGLLMLNEMAKTGGKKPIELMGEREKGRDWDRLATENKYDLSSALPKLERVQQAMEAQQKQPKR